ncbi:uncharacterized protein LOC113463874 isoform X2 [Ceratina calcarata]|uniref:Uncharacterized protein LOC113463874 isoform X2 n=1 Tax=Ceratina calcarata TaxID=156304 RepID=A0AAJ7RVY0_9HYME|nr:uncharacterized protein LOC113463874 isoform X2 [Ceratina calcarata]
MASHPSSNVRVYGLVWWNRIKRSKYYQRLDPSQMIYTSSWMWKAMFTVLFLKSGSTQYITHRGICLCHKRMGQTFYKSFPDIIIRFRYRILKK